MPVCPLLPFTSFDSTRFHVGEHGNLASIFTSRFTNLKFYLLQENGVAWTVS